MVPLAPSSAYFHTEKSFKKISLLSLFYKINWCEAWQMFFKNIATSDKSFINTLKGMQEYVTLTLIVRMNTRSVNTKFDEDGNVVTKTHPFHNMKWKQVWGGVFFGSRRETAAQLCRAPHSGPNQWGQTLRHTCKEDSISSGHILNICTSNRGHKKKSMSSWLKTSFFGSG